jgi:Relaxase/Mobilisation nuclease domain
VIERDEGEPLQGKGAAKALIDDWDLDLDVKRPTANLKLPVGRKTPKVIHKMIFSMPAGTPPEKVLAAVKNFAREEFALKHRYAMVLHTDESHPHVHMVVKAMAKDGRRLNIRHATLREWRREFARHLQAQGVEANATERVVRGVAAPQKIDGIYRAAKRGASTQWRRRAQAVVRELASGESKIEPGKARLLGTRHKVIQGWSEIADALVLQGQADLAGAVRYFVKRLPPARTEREWIRDRLLAPAAVRSDRPAERLRQRSDAVAVRLAAERAQRRLTEQPLRDPPDRQKELASEPPSTREGTRDLEWDHTR